MRLLKFIQTLLIVSGIFSSTCLNAQSDTSRTLSQYLFDNFSKGVVKMKNGTVTSTLMNYNVLSEKMVFEQSGKYLDLTNSESVDTIYLHNTRFIPMVNTFLEVVAESSIPLYVQHRGDLMSPGKASAYGGTSQTTSSTSYSTVFTDNKTYNINLPAGYSVDKTAIYWVMINGKLEKFLNERQFLRLFKSNETVIRAFIRENNISFNNRSDLIKLLYFCSGV